MLTIYNKVDKSEENTSGFQVVPSVEQLERPFLLCLSAQNNYSKTIFGIMREGAQAARLLTTQGVAGRFKLNEFPVDFLGVRFERDGDYHQAHTEIAEKMIYPFLTKHGKSFEEMRKQASKMNIMTYCDGAYTWKGVEERLEVLLKRDGLTDQEIDQLLSLVSLVALETSVETGKLHATSAAFIDANDEEVEGEKNNSYRELLNSQPYRSLYAPLGKTNGTLYIYEGRGIHGVKEFFRDDSIAKPAVSAVVSMFLENSLDNDRDDEIIPITVEDIMARLDQFANENEDIDDALDRLDNSLIYDGAPRYTKEGAQMRMELDEIYKVLRKTNNMFIRSLQEKEGQAIRLCAAIRGIHEFSSDVTFKQILTYAHMLQPRDGSNIISAPSDKQVRATILSDENGYESLQKVS